MVLRDLTLADLDAVVALERELFGLGAWPHSIFTEELAAPGRRYLVVDVEGELLGYAGALLGDESHLMTIGVAPSARRRGYASAMLAELMSAARSAGATSMVLEVRADEPGPQELYRRFGFTPIGLRRGYYQLEGADAVVMKAELAN